jgi:hypothetical protein
MWPFSRRRSDASRGESTPAPYAPGRAEWRQLPPLQRVVGDQWLVNPPGSLSTRLASWQDPTYLAPLGHAVVPAGPSGAIEPAPVPSAPAEPRRIDLQRKAGPIRDDASTPVRSLQRTASGRSDPDREAARGKESEPDSLQRLADAEPPHLGSGPAPNAVIGDRPLVGDDSGLPHLEPLAAQRDADARIEPPMNSEPQAPSRSFSPLPSLQRSPQSAPDPIFRADQPSEAVTSLAAPLPVRPVSPPYAVQRMLIGDHTTNAIPPVPGPSAVPHAASSFPSLLASTDPPERRELPVVAASRLSTAPEGRRAATPSAAVQRSTGPTGDTAPLLGGSGPGTSLALQPIEADTAAQPGEPDTEAPLSTSPHEGVTAPLLGATGLAAPIVQTSQDAAPVTEPRPIAPLLADQSHLPATGAAPVQRLGLGSPLSGPFSGLVPSVQRSSTRPSSPPPSAAGPSGPRSGLQSSAPGLGAPQPSPQHSLQRSDSAPLSQSATSSFSLGASSPPTRSEAAPPRPLPPPVMVMRSGASTEAMPVASRSIEAPEPLYTPDPLPEAPLLGLRPFETGHSGADGESTAGGPSAFKPHAGEPGSVQRSTWTHMPTPVSRADFSLPEPDAFAALPTAPPSAGASETAAAPATVQRLASPVPVPVASGPLPGSAEPLPVAAAPVSLQNMPVQSVSVQAMTEVTPPPVEAVIQRVAAPPPSITVQAVDAAPTPTAAPATAGAAPAADPAALLAVLYEPLVRRLRADLRVDRERRGRLTDL